MTQQELAERLGVNFRFVSRCEIGDRGISLAMLQRIAEVLGVRASALLEHDAPIPELDITADEAAWLTRWRAMDAAQRDVATRVLDQLGPRRG